MRPIKLLSQSISSPDANGEMTLTMKYSAGPSGVPSQKPQQIAWVGEDKSHGAVYTALNCADGVCTAKFNRNEIPSHGRIFFSTSLRNGTGKHLNVDVEPIELAPTGNEVKITKVIFKGCPKTKSGVDINIDFEYKPNEKVKKHTFLPYQGRSDSIRNEISGLYCRSSPCSENFRFTNGRNGHIHEFDLEIENQFDTAEINLLSKEDLKKNGIKDLSIADALRKCLDSIPYTDEDFVKTLSIKKSTGEPEDTNAESANQ